MLRQILVDYLEKLIAKKQDADLTALFDGFSTAVGDGTTAMSAALIFQCGCNIKIKCIKSQ